MWPVWDSGRPEAIVEKEAHPDPEHLSTLWEDPVPATQVRKALDLSSSHPGAVERLEGG